MSRFTKVEEFGREVYKLVKQFTSMAKKGEDKEKGDVVRRKKKPEEEVNLDEKFPTLKVAHTVQHQIKDFKVLIPYCVFVLRHYVSMHFVDLPFVLCGLYSTVK